MLVDAVRMRERGEKLSMSAIEGAMPVRGYLRYWRWRFPADPTLPFEGWAYSACITAEDRLLGGPSLLPQLSQARLQSIRGGYLVLVGEESFEERPAVTVRFLQAWLCRPVADPTFPLRTLRRRPSE